MEDGTYFVERNPHARTFTFVEFASVIFKERLNIPPFHVSPNGIREDRGEGFIVLAHPLNSIIG
jgi:hypothetical protein